MELIYTVKLEMGGNEPTETEQVQLKKMFEQFVKNFCVVCGNTFLKTVSLEGVQAPKK